VVTVSQLRSERKRAMRGVRTSLNRFQRAFNLLHRELDRRLEQHRSELLDLKDAQRIIELSNECDSLWQDYKFNVAPNLELYFR
jgi:hypothetical protein